jgi:uncharacterized membrane protein YhaH (DUF805 family)
MKIGRIGRLECFTGECVLWFGFFMSRWAAMTFVPALYSLTVFTLLSLTAVVVAWLRLQRAHDLGDAGITVLLTIVPIVGAFVLGWMYLAKGKPENEWGAPPPKRVFLLTNFRAQRQRNKELARSAGLAVTK